MVKAPVVLPRPHSLLSFPIDIFLTTCENSLSSRVLYVFLFCPCSQLEQKQVTPPYKPRLESDRDLANFPPEFTDEPVQLTPDDK